MDEAIRAMKRTQRGGRISAYDWEWEKIVENAKRAGMSPTVFCREASKGHNFTEVKVTKLWGVLAEISTALVRNENKLISLENKLINLFIENKSLYSEQIAEIVNANREVVAKQNELIDILEQIREATFV
jgi:hypothetical protein